MRAALLGQENQIVCRSGCEERLRSIAKRFQPLPAGVSPPFSAGATLRDKSR
jgi:hypothetical protein